MHIFGLQTAILVTEHQHFKVCTESLTFWAKNTKIDAVSPIMKQIAFFELSNI
jgi:hypothetical protein